MLKKKTTVILKPFQGYTQPHGPKFPASSILQLFTLVFTIELVNTIVREQPLRQGVLEGEIWDVAKHNRGRAICVFRVKWNMRIQYWIRSFKQNEDTAIVNWMVTLTIWMDILNNDPPLSPPIFNQISLEGIKLSCHDNFSNLQWLSKEFGHPLNLHWILYKHAFLWSGGYNN